MPAFAVERETPNPQSVTVFLSGEVGIADAGVLWDQIQKHTAGEFANLNFDLSKAQRLDGAAVALLHAARRELRGEGKRCEILHPNSETARLLDLYEGQAVCPKAPPCCPGLMNQVGKSTVEVLSACRDVFRFVGSLTDAVIRTLRDPKSLQWSDIPHLLERAGADSVPIVLLINFLVGLVLGLQSALQLEQFGVGIYVADLVGKSVVRELGPLMTAIIAAGRSGAAYAAEIGTMKVSEEIDALRTMGFDPLRTLVLPRILALAIMLPLLTLLGNFVGLVGGFVVGVTILDLTPITYVQQTQGSVVLWDLWGGLIKASFFGVTVAVVACQQGLATRGGASGVGRSTTSAVVAILFFLISLDALFAYIYTLLGI